MALSRYAPVLQTAGGSRFAPPEAGDPYASRYSAKAATMDAYGMNPQALVTPRPGQQDGEGILSRFVGDVRNMISGSAKVLAGAAGEGLNDIGLAVPISWQDVSQADKRGAMLMTATLAGGAVAGPVGGLIGAGETVLGRAAASAVAETAAGAAFGMLKPLDPGEERLSAVAGNALFGGALGAGFSFARSALRATVGGRIAAVKDAFSRMKAADMATQFDAIKQAREVLGVTLSQAGTDIGEGVQTTGDRAAIRRLANGKVRVSVADPASIGGRAYKALDEAGTRFIDFPEFNNALQWASEHGFTDEGASYKTVFSKADRKMLGEDLLTKIDRGEVELPQLDLQLYRSWRDADGLAEQAHREMGAVAAEAAVPSDELGMPKLPELEKRAYAKQLGISAEDVRAMSDSDLLRSAVKGGLVDFSMLPEGMNHEMAAREVMINGTLSGEQLGARVVSHTVDSFMSKIVTARTMEKFYPVLTPMMESLRTRQSASALRLQGVTQRLLNLKLAVPEAEANAGVSIIELAGQRAQASSEDEVQMQAWRTLYGADGADDKEVVVRAARQLALQQAAQVGGGAARFVNESTDILERYRSELQQIGKLEHGGLAGYFPIVNGNDYKLIVGGKPVDTFATKAEALQHLVENYGPGTNATVTKSSFWMEGDGMAPAFVDPAVYGKFVRAVKNASTEEMSWADAKAAVSGEGIAPGGGVRRTGSRLSGNLKQRSIGIRDWDMSPHDALTFYSHQIERFLSLEASPQSLAARLADQAAPLVAGQFKYDVEQTAQRVLPEQTQLMSWVRTQEADAYGRPRPEEVWLDKILQLGGIDVAPRALQRWSALARRAESFSRLGGFFSSIVNLTQIPLNGGAILGTDIVRGLPAAFQMLRPGKVAPVIQELVQHGFDPALLGSDISEEGLTHIINTVGGNLGTEGVPAGSIRAALLQKQYGDAIYRTALFAFNKSEAINRTVVGWAAYKSALADIARDGGSELAQTTGAKRAAVSKAMEIVRRTQFDYTRANTPEMLRSPLGAVALQFKSFVINEMEFLAQLNKREFSRFSAALWALGGMSTLTNLPGADLADAATGWLTGQSIQERLKSSDNPGVFEGLHNAAVFGLPGLLGVDLSQNVGAGGVRDVARGLVGPAIRDVYSFGKFLGNGAVDLVQGGGTLSTDTVNEAMQGLLPTAVRRMEQAYGIWQTGEVRNPYNGKLIYRPVDRAGEAMKTFVGAPSIRLQQERIADTLFQRARDQYITAKNGFARDAARAVRSGDGQEAHRVLEQAASTGYPIEPRTLQFWVQELGRPAEERRIRGTPKQQRAQLADMLSATGTLDAQQLGLVRGGI